ncbi:MAG: PLP-dependent aminotransferase family protein [Hyphomicrobiales bacterium]|nr:PLP-dependent aminotransferase family protein [Hyphomicrobiales bacterium]MCP5371693.1 PLP-dependent aminotransferase family protein [Hyphomicrobiales bacterium]
MTIWVPHLAGRSGPKYLAIADAIAESISDGSLAAGCKLPPQRNLAYDLGVTLGTVTRAYKEAEQRGLVGGEVGRGTYVLGPASDAVARFASSPRRGDNFLDLTHATPVAGIGGDALARTLREISSESGLEALIAYQGNTGLDRHLRTGAQWLAGMDLPNPVPERVAITCGAQQGILTALMTLTRPGDVLLAEAFSYPGFIYLAGQLGLKLEPVPMDADGIIPEALDEACRRLHPRAIYLTPTLQNPTTALLPEDRRRRVAEIARRHDLFIMEDDVWGSMFEGRPTPIAALAPERTFFITSLSKSMAGGLRVGFVYAPADYVERLRSSVRMSNWMAPPLMVEIAHRWITGDVAQEMTRRQRQETETRTALCARHLGPFHPRIRARAHFLWLDLPAPWRANDFQAEAEERGILLHTIEAFAVGRQPAPHAVRIGLGGAMNMDELERALVRLADQLRAPPGLAPEMM